MTGLKPVGCRTSLTILLLNNILKTYPIVIGNRRFWRSKKPHFRKQRHSVGPMTFDPELYQSAN